MQIQIYSIIIFETNTKTNIFRLTKKGKYNHKYIWVEEKKAHTNRSRNIRTRIRKYKNNYQYLLHTGFMDNFAIRTLLSHQTWGWIW